jgi:hypothetical protein
MKVSVSANDGFVCVTDLTCIVYDLLHVRIYLYARSYYFICLVLGSVV